MNPAAEFLVESRQKFKSFPPCYSRWPLQLCLEISVSSNSRNLLQFLRFSYCTPQVGSHPLSPLFCTGSFLKDLPYWPRNYSIEKNQVPRELALIAKNLACLVAQWYWYGGSWKWVTILSILVGMVHLHMYTQLDCQHFVHYISLVLLTFLRTPHGFSLLKGTHNFQNYLRWKFLKVCAH